MALSQLKRVLQDAADQGAVKWRGFKMVQPQLQERTPPKRTLQKRMLLGFFEILVLENVRRGTN